MNSRPKPGKITLLNGDASDTKEFTKIITTSDRILVNNYEDVFSSRGTKKKGQNRSLDDFIASYFAQSRIGTRLVSLTELLSLGPDRDEMNRERNNAGLSHSDNASFFSHKTKVLEGVFSWNKNPRQYTFHIYERLRQNHATKLYQVSWRNPGELI